MLQSLIGIMRKRISGGGPGTMLNKLTAMLVAWKHAQFVGETPRG